ncbi:MAG TPA: tRNA (adenosine(37)-N6)-dimethylallyltransferase MiaA, partial [Clostridiales bacterium]|nr:tRNA (adenosine(37)-N6)-dimethylallyltransferase MiaA [Clostridiales bacterium]
MIPAVIVAGATASGKTALSIELAKRLKGEIVSCDSMQIYKGMDIGTAKPTKAEMQGIPHHMIDILEPSQSFSVAEFCDMARTKISDIANCKKLPILTGGTGLYIDSLIENIDFAEETGKPDIRNELFALSEKEGKDAVYEILLKIDPEYAKIVHPNNVKRVIRAIEFYKTTGMTVTEHNKLPKTPIYKYAYFCIAWDREVLYDRINKRVDEMIESGLCDEARTLYEKYGRANLTALSGIG